MTNRVCINSKDVFVESGFNANDIFHVMADFEFQGRHRGVEMNLIEVLEEQDLTVTFATIPRFRTLCWFSDLDYDQVT